MTTIEELVSVKAELASAMEQIKSGVSLVASANKERDDIKANLVAIEAKHTDEMKKSSDALTALQAENVKMKSDLEAAQKALANPAFAAAASKGDGKAVSEGNSEAAESLTYEQASAEYSKIKGAQARADYRAAHAVELKLK